MFYTKANVINLETDYVNCSKIVKKTHWLNTQYFPWAQENEIKTTYVKFC